MSRLIPILRQYFNKVALILLLLITILFSQRTDAQVSDSSFVVMTYNIRYDNPTDPEKWGKRMVKIASTVVFHEVDILGIQEGLDHQLNGLDSLLKGYSRIGVGRDDGKKAGEYCAIYYKKSRYQLIHDGTYWLSENPMLPGSKSWDAALPRIASFVVLREFASLREICLFNAHLDHVGEESRIRSAQLISALLNREAGRRPHMVLGDFNEAKPGAVWQWFNSIQSGMIDPADLVQKHGPDFTYNAFSMNHTSTSGMIDHIFISRDLGVGRYGVISEGWTGMPASDHFPVLGEFFWPR
jgi:endonuclease/exonuclease/phosphatase family metal-dependent hydrolase